MRTIINIKKILFYDFEMFASFYGHTEHEAEYLCVYKDCDYKERRLCKESLH